MEKKNTTRKNLWNFAVALCVTAILFGAVSLAYDLLYCLNDDLMLQSILSGGLSGTPSGMAVYMSVPLSSLLAFLYGVLPGIPWLGVFLAGCYIICFFLSLYAILESADSIKKNSSMQFLTGRIWIVLGICVMSVFIFLGFFLSQYLMIHYTVAAAVVGGTGLFLFLVSAESRDWKTTIRSAWLPIVLLLVCYLIRTKVFFMVLPFLAAAGVYRMLRTKSILNYLLPVGCLGAGLLLLMLTGRICYGSATWQEYLKYNDERTALYDYAEIWTDDSAADYYSNHGFSTEEMSIYKDYNILLNETLKAEDFSMIASYAECRPEGQRKIFQKLKEGIWLYRNRTLNSMEDFPYHITAIICYVVLLMLFLSVHDKSSVFALILLGMARSALWVYLLMEGRYPERVTVSLYLIELLVLLAMLWNAVKQMITAGDDMSAKLHSVMQKIGAVFALAVVLILSLEAVYHTLPEVSEAWGKQIALNREEDKVYHYMLDHPGNLYLLDVYATVDRTEYVFKNAEGTGENYLLLGGWAAGSPHISQKLSAWGYESAFDALERGENVFLVLKDGVGMDIEELTSYYLFRTGKEAVFERIDEVITERGNFGIYRRGTIY